mmetsp:Transcript_6072/g.12054  ORF Transcript_6072/g.12054 Transcript_6072/m.12054 type:complete len:206 (+) Transcript_6072:176-793(+)
MRVASNCPSFGPAPARARPPGPSMRPSRARARGRVRERSRGTCAAAPPLARPSLRTRARPPRCTRAADPRRHRPPPARAPPARRLSASIAVRPGRVWTGATRACMRDASPGQNRERRRNRRPSRPPCLSAPSPAVPVAPVRGDARGRPSRPAACRPARAVLLRRARYAPRTAQRSRRRTESCRRAVRRAACPDPTNRRPWCTPPS